MHAERIAIAELEHHAVQHARYGQQAPAEIPQRGALAGNLQHVRMAAAQAETATAAGQADDVGQGDRRVQLRRFHCGAVRLRVQAHRLVQ